MASSSQTVGTSPEGNSPESHSGDWNNGEGYRCFFTASSCAKTTYINIPISQKLPILGPTRNNMGMDQYLLIPFLGGWTSIYQLFWCELQGYKVLTHCPMCVFFFISALFRGTASSSDPGCCGGILWWTDMQQSRASRLRFPEAWPRPAELKKLR